MQREAYSHERHILQRRIKQNISDIKGRTAGAHHNEELQCFREHVEGLLAFRVVAFRDEYLNFFEFCSVGTRREGKKNRKRPPELEECSSSSLRHTTWKHSSGQSEAGLTSFPFTHRSVTPPRAVSALAHSRMI